VRLGFILIKAFGLYLTQAGRTHTDFQAIFSISYATLTQFSYN